MAISLGFGTVLRFLPVSFGNSQSSSPARLGRACICISRLVTKIYAASKQATETGKLEPKGMMKLLRVSLEMQELLGGVAEIQRTQALKEIWAYIKLYDLQVIQDLFKHQRDLPPMRKCLKIAVHCRAKYGDSRPCPPLLTPQTCTC